MRTLQPPMPGAGGSRWKNPSVGHGRDRKIMKGVHHYEDATPGYRRWFSRRDRRIARLELRAHRG